MKVLVSDPLNKEGMAILEEAEGIEVVEKTGLSEDELIKEIKDYQGIIVRSGTTVTRPIIEAAANLKVIGRAGSGVDNVDVKAATSRGIVVMNVPGGNTIAVVELTMGLLVCLARSIPAADTSLKSGLWERKKFQGSELYGKTLGIIGLGWIGSGVALRARAFEMKVIGFDPYVNEEKARGIGVELVSLDKIYKESDYITIHTPLSKETTHLIGREEIDRMKDGVRIINCARGGVVDEEALISGLRNGKVAGCALDTYETEPPLGSPLLTMSNCITLPHIGAQAKEAQVRVAVEMAKQVVDFLKEGKIKNAVN
ncbi:phosphoglycerate dehydrogenase [bacterium]|nr:phosphoglycerate dehydrogenase [bacterium]